MYPMAEIIGYRNFLPEPPMEQLWQEEMGLVGLPIRLTFHEDYMLILVEIYMLLRIIIIVCKNGRLAQQVE